MRRGIYIASKAKHGPRWHALRASGVPIVSTWIDKSGEGQISDWNGLWERIEAEIQGARGLVFFGEEGETQKCAMVEIGIAIGCGTPVFWVGPEACTIRRTNFVTVCATLDEALDRAGRGWSGAFTHG